MVVRDATGDDRDWIASFLAEQHSVTVARRGELVQPLDHPMLLAETDGRPAGLLTYVVDGHTCEILTLHATAQWHGAGTALVAAVEDRARRLGCTRLWVLTTNDNVDALRFYQRRGFRLSTLRPGAVDEARRNLKPQISETGEYGISLRDEIELTMDLAGEPHTT
jgi:GNAT superfamily N-acetyltransferase